MKYSLFSSLFFSFDRKKRKLLLIILDFFLIAISIITAFWFLNDNSFIDNFQKYKINEFVLLNLIFSLPIYYFTGQYKGITKFIGSYLLYRFTIRNFLIIITRVSQWNTLDYLLLSWYLKNHQGVWNILALIVFFHSCVRMVL